MAWGAALLPAALLLAWQAGEASVTWQPGGALLAAAAVLSPGVALLSRHSLWRYRALLGLSVGLLSALVVLGGPFLGVYFLPAVLCALWALGCELLAGRAV